MDVLNRNQRQSAIWRILGMAMTTLALIGVLLFTTYKAYASQGIAEAIRLQNEHEKKMRKWQGDKKQLENDIKDLKNKLDECLKNNGGKELATCKEILEKKEDELEGLEDELEACTSDLKILNAVN